MNTKLIFNLARVIAAGAILFAGMMVFKYSQEDDEAITRHLKIIISAIYTVGGGLLAFLPYGRIK
ncbi:MAG: hypothetical protein A2Y10_15325 [Planctomycetes bacterium GWF2_41_51]|nr:MAG: hypothetical protein A2Y10_15325 [Planctomycetes bacterium GWF2_41_51]HBG26972.1 hypothetical protein [Phycisphaerales bacterium]